MVAYMQWKIGLSDFKGVQDHRDHDYDIHNNTNLSAFYLARNNVIHRSTHFAPVNMCTTNKILVQLLFQIYRCATLFYHLQTTFYSVCFEIIDSWGITETLTFRMNTPIIYIVLAKWNIKYTSEEKPLKMFSGDVLFVS